MYPVFPGAHDYDILDMQLQHQPSSSWYSPLHRNILCSVWVNQHASHDGPTRHGVVVVASVVVVSSVVVTGGSVVVTGGSAVVVGGSVLVTGGNVVVTSGSVVFVGGSVVNTGGFVVAIVGFLVTGISTVTPVLLCNDKKFIRSMLPFRNSRINQTKHYYNPFAPHWLTVAQLQTSVLKDFTHGLKIVWQTFCCITINYFQSQQHKGRNVMYSFLYKLDFSWLVKT